MLNSVSAGYPYVLSGVSVLLVVVLIYDACTRQRPPADSDATGGFPPITSTEQAVALVKARLARDLDRARAWEDFLTCCAIATATAEAEAQEMAAAAEQKKQEMAAAAEETTGNA